MHRRRTGKTLVYMRRPRHFIGPDTHEYQVVDVLHHVGECALLVVAIPVGFAVWMAACPFVLMGLGIYKLGKAIKHDLKLHREKKAARANTSPVEPQSPVPVSLP